MKERISSALVAKYPTLKPYQATKSAAKYVEVMLDAIADSIRRFGFEDDQISLALDTISARIGRVKVGGRNVKVCSAVNADRHNALINVDFEGNVGKNSRVSINPAYLTEVMLALAELEPTITDTVKPEVVPNVHTAVDVGMLESFLKNTKQAYVVACQQASPENDKYRQALLRNLLNAKNIRAAVVEEDGQYLLPEYWEQSDSGRCYGHGISLQRVSKAVRHAAIGRCHMYDFKAASYALMTDLALGIDPTLDVEALKDYVNHRTRIRKEIAVDVGVTEERIKTIFTSLGFGAKTANNPYASIRKALGKTAYNRLMLNVQFARIGDAMASVREVIAGHFPDSFDFFGRQYSSCCPRSGQKRTKDQKLAWIYQAMEAEAITRFGAGALDAGCQPLLFVHDCVYFGQKLPAQVFAKITNELRLTFPLLEADHEYVYPIHTKDFVDPVYAQEEQRIEEHQKLMRKFNGQSTVQKVVRMSDDCAWDGEFSHIMSMVDMPDFSKLMVGTYLGKVSIDLGQSWTMPDR